MALALTKAAQGAADALRAEMDVVLDRPVSFTKRGVRPFKASKRRLVSRVVILPKQWEYLRYQVKGGTRRPRQRAIAAPVAKNVRLNRAGNLPRGKVGELLGRPRTGHKSVFSGVPRGSRFAGAAPGIWERVGNKVPGQKKLANANRKAAKAYGLLPAQPFRTHSGRATLRQLVTWLPRARYARRLDPLRAVRNSVKRDWDRLAAEAVQHTLATAKPIS